MSQVPVKWCCNADLEDKPEAVAVYGDEPVPVVPLSALREVVEGLKATKDGGGAAVFGYRKALEDLLASLGEQ